MATHSRGARTWEQVLTAKAQAARFVRNILRDEQKAIRIESESPEDYAARKKIRIKNPERKEEYMARMQDLETAILEATAELDQADGSRTAMAEAFDNARQILADSYGEKFESDLVEFTENSSDDETDSEEIDEETD
jgi:hypothetical protein